MLAIAVVWFVAVGGTGDGSAAAPFGSVQAALDVVQPGDIVEVSAGTYTQGLVTKRAATEAAPITVRGVDGTLITAPGRLLTVAHPYYVFEMLDLNAQYADVDAVRIETAGTATVLRDVDVHHAQKDCIDMIAPEKVLIERAKIHHCLNATNGRTDAHGIVAGAVKDLTIRDSYIHSFSGDGIQLDPDRTVPAWDRVLVENCEITLIPMTEPENGFPPNTVPGENAIDTKVPPGSKSHLTVRNVLAAGFRDGLIGNMAAFNLKEGVVAELDRITITGSEIGLRLRAPAEVRVSNALIFDTTVAIRYEDNVVSPRIYSSTIGEKVDAVFVEASSPATVFDAKNILVLGPALPPELPATGGSMAIDGSAFQNTADANYHLQPGVAAIDRGVAVDVATDRDGVARPQGTDQDVGAYEFCTGDCVPAPDAGGGGPGPGGGGGEGGCCRTERGSAWPAIWLVALWLRRSRKRIAS